VHQQLKSAIRVGLIFNLVFVGGTVLARLFYNRAPQKFHQFVDLSLWVTIAAGILCALLLIQVFRMDAELKKARAATAKQTRPQPSRKAQTKNHTQLQQKAGLLAFLVAAPGAFMTIPLLHGAVIFAREVGQLLKESIIFLALWTSYRAFVRMKTIMRKSRP